MYIADRQNYRIRKVNANGVISTVAGFGLTLTNTDAGIATSVGLRASYVALDGAGTLHIADTDNFRIRKLNPPTLTLISPICRQSDSFEVFYTSTITNPDQFTVTGTGISPNQTITPPSSSGSIKVNIDPATFTGSFTLTLTNSVTGFSTVPVNGTVSATTGPTAFTVTGGGSFCAGDPSGVIGLDGSQTGVNYQIYTGKTPVGGSIAGTNGTIAFGSVAQANTYIIIGTDAPLAAKRP